MSTGRFPSAGNFQALLVVCVASCALTTFAALHPHPLALRLVFSVPVAAMLSVPFLMLHRLGKSLQRHQLRLVAFFAMPTALTAWLTIFYIDFVPPPGGVSGDGFTFIAVAILLSIMAGVLTMLLDWLDGLWK